MKQIITNTEEIPPGKSLHFTYAHHRYPIEAEVSVVGRSGLEAKAVWDNEGWIVVVLTNVTGVPVKISPDDPVTVVIKPRRQAAAAAGRDTPQAEQSQQRR